MQCNRCVSGLNTCLLSGASGQTTARLRIRPKYLIARQYLCSEYLPAQLNQGLFFVFGRHQDGYVVPAATV